VYVYTSNVVAFIMYVYICIGSNGWDGLPNEGPFHFIHVGAAAEVPPQALLDQVRLR
jgi:protein-L-isoaspartate O-methyltransferase